MVDNARKPPVGFVGLGRMGQRMAARLIDAGYPLTVYNRTAIRAAPLAERGSAVAQTPRALAEAVEVVMLSLTDDAALEQVMEGPDGVLAGLRPGATVVDFSTVSPRTSRAVATKVQARGAAMLDVPVSGSTPQAERGALVALVGGDEALFQRMEPLIAHLSDRRFYLGPNGSGLVMKLVVNSLLAVSIQALAEAIALGEGAGLDRGHLLDVLGQMPVLSPSQQGKLANAQRGAYPVTFAMALMEKDLGLTAELAQEHRVPMPAVAAARQITLAALAQGADDDFSAVIRLMEQLSGVSGQRAERGGR